MARLRYGVCASAFVRPQYREGSCGFRAPAWPNTGPTPRLQATHSLRPQSIRRSTCISKVRRVECSHRPPPCRKSRTIAPIRKNRRLGAQESGPQHLVGSAGFGQPHDDRYRVAVWAPFIKPVPLWCGPFQAQIAHGSPHLLRILVTEPLVRAMVRKGRFWFKVRALHSQLFMWPPATSTCPGVQGVHHLFVMVHHACIDFRL